MQHLHSRIPCNNAPVTSRPAHIEIREEYFRGRNSRRTVVFLLTNGCEWAIKSGHGCTMCGHLSKQAINAQSIYGDEFVAQFETAFSTVDLDDIPILDIFINGSFFNDNELPPEARRVILRLVNGNKVINKLMVESRPEFITAKEGM